MCPFREKRDEKWMCELAEQECPEAKLIGFDFACCSTYLEEIGIDDWE